MNLIENLFKKFDKLEFHVKGILFSIPTTALLLAYLINVGAADLIFSEWFISLISVPMLLSNMISISAHFGRSLDVLTQKNLSFGNHKKEYICTVIGVILGLLIGIGFSAYNLFIPLSAALGFFANVIFTLRQMNIYAGLGNRIGRIADKNSRPLSEKIIIAISIALGVTLGIIMIATSSAALVSIFGITNFTIGGATLPIWLGCTIFMLSVTSMISSAADYWAKGINFIRSYYSKDNEILDRVKRFKFDYGGSLIGSIIGLFIGAVAVVALCTLSTYVVPGIVGIVSCGLVIVATTSIFGCIFSQYGRVLDSARRIIAESEKEDATKSPSKPAIKIELSPKLDKKNNNDLVLKPEDKKKIGISQTLFNFFNCKSKANHAEQKNEAPSPSNLKNFTFNHPFTKT